MGKLLKKIKLISNLETIEQKSFWITAPLVALIGLLGLGTAGLYDNALPTIISAILCLVIPVILMIVVAKKKNYHYSYPLLCILVGAICVPITFVTSGGYLSGMPLFCVVSTAITALCYEKRWRWISFITCLLGNTVAFIYAYIGEIPFPLVEDLQSIVGKETVYNDVLFGYYCTTIGLFVFISFIVSDIRKYKSSRDALQQFFDSEVRKEILNKALDGNLSLTSKHKKAVIVFADISNFTSTTEKMPSEQIAPFLNDFFSTAGKYIHETGGIIDKYIGDCVMAYWFDSEDSNCVFSAVKALLNLKMEIYSKAEQTYETYKTELNFSAGISYGDIVFGDIGSDTMHNYTVIGDAVNTASRIEHFAVGGEILISDAAAEKIKYLVKFEPVQSDHFFKGKNNPIDIYQITGLADDKEPNIVSKEPPRGYIFRICGCRGSFPVSGLRFSEYGGETSCYVIKKDDYAVIIDCGTGLKNAIEFIGDCKKVDILLTHVHYDHILGLLMSQFPENTKVRIFGRFDVWSKDSNILINFMEHPYWPVEIINTEKVCIKIGEEIHLDEQITATFFLSDHPDDACIIKLMCKDKKIVILADCEDANKIDPAISSNSELLLFDGMFDDEEKEIHKGWGHGTWQDGIRYLAGKSIKKLVITHHNPQIGDHTLMIREDKARSEAQNVSFAKTGDTFII